MAGGNKRVVVNQRERAVSNDALRFQSLLQSSWAELLSFLIDGATSEEQACGVSVRGTTTTSPLRAHVINGLLFQPQIGSPDAVVSAGCWTILGAMKAMPAGRRYVAGMGPWSTPSGRNQRTARLSPPPPSFCKAMT